MIKRFLSVSLTVLLSVVTSVYGQPLPDKLSPYLQQVTTPVTRQRAASEHMVAPLPQQTVTILAKLAEDADEQGLATRYDFEVRNRIGRILIIDIPLGNIRSMAADQQVVRLEAERAPRPMMELVPSQIGADKAHNGTDYQLPQGYTGKGVIVGIVDGGFDFIHPMFRDANGKTRVTWAHDYISNKEYATTEAVTAAMHSSDAANSYHGTHVAGIAAGSKVLDADWDQQTAYQGIAPEADIAEGAVTLDINSNTQTLAFDQTLQAFADIFEYAKQQGKPCVINFSAGDAMSFSNNRQLAEEGIRTLLQEPGRALVVASGNAGSTMRYAHKPADMQEGAVAMLFDGSSYSNFAVELKVKAQQAILLRYGGTTPAEYTATASQLKELTSFTLGGTNVKVENRGETADGYQVLYLTSGSKVFTASEDIYITVSGDGEAWLYANVMCAGFKNVPLQNVTLAEEGYSVAWPGCMPEVITVGNIAHRFKILTLANKYASQGGVAQPTDLTDLESTKGEGFLAKSSSVGPSLAGAVKPDVCAPGVNVVSAQSFFINDDTYYSLAAWDICALDTESEQWGSALGYFHMMAQTGTSMSAPAVAGAIALWMQADPTLTNERIKDIIAHSSRQPDSALSYPNNQYGYGEIDIYKGLLYMQELTGISDVLNGNNNEIIKNNNIYDLQGRKVSSLLSPLTSHLSKGLYIVNGRKVMIK